MEHVMEGTKTPTEAVMAVAAVRWNECPACGAGPRERCDDGEGGNLPTPHSIRPRTVPDTEEAARVLLGAHWMDLDAGHAAHRMDHPMEDGAQVYRFGYPDEREMAVVVGDLHPLAPSVLEVSRPWAGPRYRPGQRVRVIRTGEVLEVENSYNNRDGSTSYVLRDPDLYPRKRVTVMRVSHEIEDAPTR